MKAMVTFIVAFIKVVTLIKVESSGLWRPGSEKKSNGGGRIQHSNFQIRSAEKFHASSR
jgi:hypothetical protein